jgi:protein required for attachment to host cells
MTTWIVLADGKHARIYEHAVPGAKLATALVQDLVAEDTHAFARELGTDRPGRAFDPGSGSPHAMEPHSDPHERSKIAFARRVASCVDDAVQSKRCARIVLIAPPKMLGFLRAERGTAARAAIIASAGKDLMKIPLAELQSHVDLVLSERHYAI